MMHNKGLKIKKINILHICVRGKTNEIAKEYEQKFYKKKKSNDQ